MPRFTILFAPAVFLLHSHDAAAFLGPAPFGTAQADYDPDTGVITVSVNSVINWFVASESNSLTGSPAAGLPAGDGLVSDNDNVIGEVSFNPLTYTDVNLGPVATTGLPISDLSINWNPGLGIPLESQPVVLATGSSTNIPPQADINGPFYLDILSDPLNITLDASGSTDDGSIAPLSYLWQYGPITTNTGTNSTLTIADVNATLGGVGTYPISVEVFDGEFSDIATSTITLVSGPTPPAAAQYDPVTGEIVVSVNGVNNWFIESASSALTGDHPISLPAANGAVTDHNEVIGESSFTLFSYNDLSLGNVAQPRLPLGDLTISWTEGFGEPIHTAPVIYSIPEPTSLVLVMLGLVLAMCVRR